MAQIEKMIAKTFMDIATGLETGSFGARPRIAVTGLGSEHGEANSVAAAELAADRGVDVTLIGTAENEKFNTVKVADEDEMYKEMENYFQVSVLLCLQVLESFPLDLKYLPVGLFLGVFAPAPRSVTMSFFFLPVQEIDSSSGLGSEPG